MTPLEQFRRQKDQFFRLDPHSPLTPEQQDRFEGLTYYPENPALRLELPLEPFAEQDTVTMQTSTGDAQDYLRWGRITFEVEGETAALTVYLSPVAGGGYFLPFMDATSGGETYDSGRYLEIEPAGGGRVSVDFNLAYNPYCAYSPYWSCPIPPKENRLSVPIRAGEMKPAGDWVDKGQ
jgi:hypothetical protein